MSISIGKYTLTPDPCCFTTHKTHIGLRQEGWQRATYLGHYPIVQQACTRRAGLCPFVDSHRSCRHCGGAFTRGEQGLLFADPQEHGCRQVVESSLHDCR